VSWRTLPGGQRGWLVLLVALCLLPACRRARTSPEAQVRQAVDAVIKAARERDLKRVVAAVSEQYTDAEGNQKEQIAQLVRVQFLLHPNLYLVAKLSAVDFPEPGRAQAVVYAAMASLPGGGVPDLTKLSADVYRFELTMADQDGHWRVVRASWSPATVRDLL
jgi:hypothetical protein